MVGVQPRTTVSVLFSVPYTTLPVKLRTAAPTILQARASFGDGLVVLHGEVFALVALNELSTSVMTLGILLMMKTSAPRLKIFSAT